MKITKLKIKNCEKGYAILELLLYIAFFSILSMVVISSMLTMTRSFRESTVLKEWVQGGVMMERITREIRASQGISSISASNLKLNTKDSSGADKTIEFLLSGTNVQLLENNILTGNLNTPNIIITGLTFTQITTTEGKAVKVILSFRSSNDSLSRVQDFYSTIVLRGGY